MPPFSSGYDPAGPSLEDEEETDLLVDKDGDEEWVCEVPRNKYLTDIERICFTHKWKQYNGFSESFEYCEECGLTKEEHLELLKLSNGYQGV